MTTPADTVRVQALPAVRAVQEAYAETREGRLKTIELDAIESRQARQRFEQHIREAHEAGATLRQIGQAAGLSFQRIHQIVKGAP